MQGRPEGDLDRDLIENLRLLVDEEAPVWEAPQRSTIVSSTSMVESGPWDLARCSEVLQRWLRVGLIGLYRIDGSETTDVPPDEAFLAIDRWEEWVPGHPNLFLYLTDQGAQIGHDVWIAVAHGQGKPSPP